LRLKLWMQRADCSRKSSGDFGNPRVFLERLTWSQCGVFTTNENPLLRPTMESEQQLYVSKHQTFAPPVLQVAAVLSHYSQTLVLITWCTKNMTFRFFYCLFSRIALQLFYIKLHKTNALLTWWRKTLQIQNSHYVWRHSVRTIVTYGVTALAQWVISANRTAQYNQR